MALIKYASIVAEARGKLNGVVFARNRGGAYMRNKVSPTQPRTPAQVNVRQQMSSLAQSWRTLTDVQRGAWNALALSTVATNVFKDAKSLSGMNLYSRLNRNLDTVGATRINTPPEVITVPAVSSVSLNAEVSTNTVEVGFTPAPVPANTSYVVMATPQLSAGVSSPGNQFAIIAVLLSAAVSPQNLFTQYTTKYGSLIEGKRIFVKIFAVNRLSGAASLPITTSAIVGS